MTLPRYIDATQLEAIDQLRTELLPIWESASKPLRVVFPDMNVQRDIAHGLETIPDGFLVVYADAEVTAEPGVIWTEQYAYLRAGAVNARAIVMFYTLREAPIDA